MSRGASARADRALAVPVEPCGLAPPGFDPLRGALPAWCASNPEAIALLREIVAEQPEHGHREWLGFHYYPYRGRNASLLRKLHDAALVRASAQDDTNYYAGKPTELFKATLHPTPDELIEKLLDGEIELPVERRRAA
jgi:hypothetical protein